MQDLFDMGFSVQNSGVKNREILQKAVDADGDIRLDVPGVYPLNDTVLLKSDISLYFGAGVYLSRTCEEDETGPLFINRGAYNGQTDRNIRIDGMKIKVNNVQNDHPAIVNSKKILGLNAVVAFSYVQDVVVQNFEILDLKEWDFALQFCTFQNVLVENVRIEGLKDAVHFGRGKNFTVRHGMFRTFDDPIALNAHDYDISNPQLGWIENGLIEDCVDLADDSTTGFFCRILAGAWVKWFPDMEIQKSDTVIANGRLYRAILPPDGKIFISKTCPSHEKGDKEYDGILWHVCQEDEMHNCGCRNIHFKDIYLEKNRPTAFCIHFDDDNWSRSFYPNAIPPVQENLVFENIVCDAKIDQFLECRTPFDYVKITNSCIEGDIYLRNLAVDGLEYRDAKIYMSGNTLRKPVTIKADEGRKAIVTANCNFGEELSAKGDVSIN